MPSERIEEAKRAYSGKDVLASRKAHGEKRIHEDVYHRKTEGTYVGDLVYGALDGIITTFAVVAGAAGAALSPAVILILGFANLLGDGVSMAMGNYLSTKSEMEYKSAERAREAWEIENIPAEEREELRQIYEKKGLRGHVLEEVIDVLTSNRENWVDTMMLEELYMVPEDKSPVKSGLATFLAFIIAGIIPLLAFILTYALPSLSDADFGISLALTALAVFAAGSARSYVTGKKWYIAGVEMTMVGSLAAGAAYLTGALLGGVV